MTEAPDHPRQRMIQSALVLMGQHGIEATSFSQVLEHSGAPRGSIYHHFPGGKAQLVVEATKYAGDVVESLIEQTIERHGDPVAAVEAIGDFWRTVLYDSDFAAGCPVVAASLVGDHSPSARAAAREVFERWERGYTNLLTHAGVDETRARALASIAISAVEGAVILARAERSNAPLERVLEMLRTLFRDAVRGGDSASGS